MKALETILAGTMLLSQPMLYAEIVQTQEQQEQQLQEEQYAPDFTLEDVDGNTICLDSLVAKGPVIMSFWAIWCKMCIKELDALRKYNNKFDSLDVNVLAVSQDKSRSVPKVKPFSSSHKWEYIVALDPENKMRELYNIQAMPTLFIINQDKRIVFTHQGYKPGDEKKIIEKIYEITEDVNKRPGQ